MTFRGCSHFLRIALSILPFEKGRVVNDAVTQHVSSAGVVLAAGAGTRYGMPKVLAGNGGWLASAVAALSDGGCGDVVVVLGAAVPVSDIDHR
jgi:hypothetical protein